MTAIDVRVELPKKLHPESDNVIVRIRKANLSLELHKFILSHILRLSSLLASIQVDPLVHVNAMVVVAVTLTMMCDQENDVGASHTYSLSL